MKKYISLLFLFLLLFLSNNVEAKNSYCYTSGTTLVCIDTAVIPASDCSVHTTAGVLCLDTDDNTLYIGNGTTATQIGGGGGTGDVNSVGDCLSGACLDGTSDGGTYIRIYDGSSNYSALVSSNISSDITITLPSATSTLYGTGSGSISSANLSTSMSDETGTGYVVFSSTPTLTTPKIGNSTTSAGYIDFLEDSDNGTDYVRIKGKDDSGTSGSFTFSSSVSNSEDLTIALGANDNTVTVSSSTGVTDISFSAINLVTTGAVKAGVNRIGTFASPQSQSGAYTLTAANSYNTIIFYNDSEAINLPTAVAGMNICVYITSTNAATLNPQDGDVIVIDGTANGAGQYVQLAGAAGNFVCLISDAANKWVTMGAKGTLTAE